jgi:N-acetylneuraminate synthase
MQSQVDKHSLTPDQEQLRRIFGRSLVASRNLVSGETLQLADVAYKKPGGGLRYEDLSTMVGRKLRRSIEADDALSQDDVEMN